MLSDDNITGGLVKLDLALDYPVYWDFERILRDLVQNFYDECGAEGFAKNVSIRYEPIDDCSYVLVIECKDHPFSYEWLTYIGGSTKTNSPGQYIGMYGEGFKICMLRLLQLKYTDCVMESSTWSITPCVYNERIAGKNIEMLGYDYTERKDDGYSRLTIRGLPGRYNRYINEIKYHFFYPENKLFGKKIALSTEYRIYTRSKIQCPSDCEAESFKGILYINNLARGRLNIPLIINIRMDMSKSDSRRRDALFLGETVRRLTLFSTKFSAADSYKILIYLRDLWSDMPKEVIDVKTWYYFICQLVRNVSRNRYYRDKFQKAYPDLYYIDRLCFDKHKNRIIRETKGWIAGNGLDEKNIVNPIFRLLGASSLIEEYLEKKDELYNDGTEEVQKRIGKMYSIIEDTMHINGLYSKRPMIIFPNDTKYGKYDPYQFAERDYSKNKYKYRLEKLVMNEDMLTVGELADALIYFFSILIFAMCGSRSDKRAYILTYFATLIIMNRKAIEERLKEDA